MYAMLHLERKELARQWVGLVRVIVDKHKMHTEAVAKFTAQLTESQETLATLIAQQREMSESLKDTAAPSFCRPLTP